MTRLRCALSLALFAAPVFAALPVEPAPDQAALLKSKDPKLAANKKIAYDFFRVVLRGRHLDQAEKYMKDDYIQHNPNADTGIVGFKAYFTKLGGPQAIPDTLPGLVAIQAEGNFVTLSFVRELDDPSDGEGVIDPSSDPRTESVSGSDSSSATSGAGFREDRVAMVAFVSVLAA